jgi:hypothetical protein
MDQEVIKNEIGRSTLSLLLIRGDRSARRLQTTSSGLRTRINFESLFYNNIEEISFSDIKEIKVVAPYFQKNRSYVYMMVGFAIGLYVAYYISKSSLIPFSFVISIFACVSFVVGSHFDSAMKLAHVKMKSDKFHMIAYKKEDEHQVRNVFKDIIWKDDEHNGEETPLLKSEKIHLEKIRIGLTIVAGSLSVIIMTFISDYLPQETPDEIDIPLSILYISVFVFSIFFSIAGFYKLFNIYKNS